MTGRKLSRDVHRYAASLNRAFSCRGTILGKYIRDKLRADRNRRMPARPRVRINTIGFFYESPDLGSFLWALAREHEGSFVGMSKP